eukprot:767662-Hanusia_phi.AAC.6
MEKKRTETRTAERLARQGNDQEANTAWGTGRSCKKDKQQIRVDKIRDDLPDRRQDEEHLHKDSSKGQEPADEDRDQRA